MGRCTAKTLGGKPVVKREKIGWIFIWTVATIVLALTLLFFAGVPNAQELTKEALSAKAAKAKVGDVLTKYDAVELIKADANKITAKIYATPKWDKQGNLLVAYETGTGIIRTQGKYVRFVPDEATGKLAVKRTVLNASVKEDYTVPNDKTTRLVWTVETDATATLNKGALLFTDRGAELFRSPAPVAWDADKKPVELAVSFDGKVLTYTIAPRAYRYPVTVDPTTTVNASTINSPTGKRDVYADARDSAGDARQYDRAKIGQEIEISDYFVYRAGLTFAGIPDNIDVLSAATLVLDGIEDQSVTNFNICVFTGTWTGGAANAEDFVKFDGRRSGAPHNGVSLCAAWSTSGYSADDNTFTFLSVGRDSIRACSGDTLRLMMVSSKDSSNTAPTGLEYVRFTGSSDPPYLSLTYSVRGGLTRTTIYNREPNYIWKNGDTVPIWKP